MHVRPAVNSDAAAIAALTTQLGYDAAAPAVGERLARLLASPDARILVAEVDGAVVGWVHVLRTETVETEACAVIGGLVVERERRRQGIGAALMGEAEAWARAQGLSMMRLRSTVTRLPAHRFYQGLGYSNVKTQHSFVKALDERGAVEAARLIPRVDPEVP